MRYPKSENWTLTTTERVIKILEKLFEQYESLSEVNEFGQEINPKANQIYLKGFNLENKIPIEHLKNYKRLFT